ncbi:SDR family oxidoreductase [Herbiconiux moechotypicola]|uniref:SDR family oxidoreductase n=1 Tax=Herbiconiux moechotypicola TaxID=637393 RepID=UPI00217DA025|nr:SDR family oxidoreductase [Herbiconiux moechotypicola]MCS5729147.1 SDR family oxidoreductase [Herbiconiux moechotypicola]
MSGGAAAAAPVSALDEIVRASRELGGDPAYVLHGGGNTSVKTVETDVTGASVDVVWVKGSGWDLGTIEAAGFAPLRRARLLELAALPALTDTAMVNELRQASLSATAPTASIEAILHAVIPRRVVLHSHSDAIVALTETGHGPSRVREVLGEGVAVLEYVKPGFDLARAVARIPEVVSGQVDALVLMNHGLFTFDDDSARALARHHELVRRAAASFGPAHGADLLGTAAAAAAATAAPDPTPAASAPPSPSTADAPIPTPTHHTAEAPRGSAVELAEVRAALSAAAGRPMIVAQSEAARGAAFARRPDVAEASSRGTITPEHLIRTKRAPLVGRDVEAYADRYRAYVEQHRDRAGAELELLDPAPRVVLDPELGLLTAGRSVKDARIAEELYLHTIAVVEAADSVGRYGSLDEDLSFDIEYWELEQARIRSAGSAPLLQGEVALVTGAASGIGRAIAETLLASGAAVVGVDLSPGVVDAFGGAAWAGVQGDAGDPAVLAAAVDAAARRFGGIDVVVAAAGVFAPPTPVQNVSTAAWERSLHVNTSAVLECLRATHPFLALAPRGGRFVLVSSKNVPAPGPGAAAYSASKAAAAQLARVAALEWATDGIRVNLVQPDAVFDTGIWTPELLAERAASYGLTVEQYKTRNLLGLEVTSRDVAQTVLAVVSPALRATTGTVLTVDGGNDRVL